MNSEVQVDVPIINERYCDIVSDIGHY